MALPSRSDPWRLGPGGKCAKVAGVRAYPLFSLLLAGCTFGLQPSTPEGLAAFAVDPNDTSGGDTSGGGDTDTAPQGDAPTIDYIEPDFGPVTGGTEVTLYGTFASDVSVRVAGEEAEITSKAAKQGKLTFLTPSSPDAVAVNVQIESNGQTDRLANGFTYTPDGTGLIGLIGAVEWYDQVGTYWGSAPTDVGLGFLVPVEPGDFDWTKVYSSSPDTCASDQTYTYETDLVQADAGSGSTVQITNNGKSFTMRWDATTGQFAADSLTQADMSTGSTYDLASMSLNGANFTEYSLSPMTAVPAQFTVSAPAITGASAPQVAKGFTLSWSGGSAADGVIATLGMWDGAGTGYTETVTCYLRDDGSFTVPSGAFTKGWPVSRQLDIMVARVHFGDSTISYNNATASVMGEYIVYGAGFTK